MGRIKIFVALLVIATVSLLSNQAVAYARNNNESVKDKSRAEAAYNSFASEISGAAI